MLAIGSSEHRKSIASVYVNSFHRYRLVQHPVNVTIP